MGKGSVFFAILPLRIESSATVDESRPAVAAPDDASTIILVIEDDARDRALLVQTLHRAGYGVEMAATGTQAIAASMGRTYDAITLDLLLPDMTGLDVLHRIRSEGKNRDTPVVVVTVVADKGMVGGFAVHDYLTKPVNGTALVGSLRRGGVSADENAPILVVDDDPSALKLMEAALKPLGYRVTCCPNGDAGLRAARETPPRAIVLDLLMPEMDGFDFLAHLRDNPTNRKTPVIVWTMKDLTRDDRARLERLAHSVVTKGLGTVTLVEELRALLTGPLTGESSKS